MRQLAIIGAALLLTALAAGCGGTRTVVKTVTVSRPAPSKPSATGDQRIFGRIESLQRAGAGYELRLDPVWFLSGVTANVAQAEDQGLTCRPAACPPVANDNYRLDEGHRVLVYLVPAGARGTVLAKGGTSGLSSRTISAAELADLVAGRSSLKLFEPLSTGVWILVHVDTVRTFAQQYLP